MSKYPKGLLYISEEEKLKIRLNSTYEERFVKLMGLIALDRMLKKNIVIHKSKTEN
jgi:hypothetical protein